MTGVLTVWMIMEPKDREHLLVAGHTSMTFADGVHPTNTSSIPPLSQEEENGLQTCPPGTRGLGEPAFCLGRRTWLRAQGPGKNRVETPGNLSYKRSVTYSTIPNI